MTARDPAAARFAIINLTRIGGVACVIVGMLIASDRLFVSLRDWVGYPFIAVGLVGAFVAPVRLARKWRTPQ
jgi:hypothetical protein